MNDIERAAQTEREQRIGRRSILLKEKENLRMLIDAIL